MLTRFFFAHFKLDDCASGTYFVLLQRSYAVHVVGCECPTSLANLLFHPSHRLLVLWSLRRVWRWTFHVEGGNRACDPSDPTYTRSTYSISGIVLRVISSAISFRFSSPKRTSFSGSRARAATTECSDFWIAPINGPQSYFANHPP